MQLHCQDESDTGSEGEESTRDNKRKKVILITRILITVITATQCMQHAQAHLQTSTVTCCPEHTACSTLLIAYLLDNRFIAPLQQASVKKKPSQKKKKKAKQKVHMHTCECKSDRASGQVSE